MDESVLELSGATVIKDGRRVLDSVSLSIGTGQHTAIIGPNGAGKSILVSLLTLDQRPLAAAGRTAPVKVFGRENWALFELRSHLGFGSAGRHPFVV